MKIWEFGGNLDAFAVHNAYSTGVSCSCHISVLVALQHFYMVLMCFWCALKLSPLASNIGLFLLPPNYTLFIIPREQDGVIKLKRSYWYFVWDAASYIITWEERGLLKYLFFFSYLGTVYLVKCYWNSPKIFLHIFYELQQTSLNTYMNWVYIRCWIWTRVASFSRNSQSRRRKR